MKFTSKIVLAAGLASALLGSVVTAGADTLATVKERGKLIVGVKTDYVPFGYLDPAGKIVGLEPDLARVLAKKILGSEDAVELVPVLSSNRMEFLQAGRIDLILATLGYTAERAKVLDYTEPFYAVPGASILAPPTTKLSGWEAFRGKPVCGIQGAFYNKTVTEKFGIKLVNFTAMPEAYKALQDNRCLGLAFDDMTLRKKPNEEGWKDYSIVAEPYENVPQPGGARKNDAAFLEAVNKALIEAEAEGVLIALQEKYDIAPSEYLTKRAEAAKKKIGN
ncbi:transporter substrate-binding domain-containing protein [Terrihabitans sp. B22-R8]|uniref:transporter substrate-binding domain-containing protein n=1 Tax=Terrihabitans sp. B22-R8 TaxID=3425128 RepID=UPI00403D4CA0